MQGLRERKRERLRRAIIETSERLLREQGLPGMRISDIAAALEIGEATLYRYFPSKTKLLRSLHRHLMLKLAGRIARTTTGASMEERLCAGIGSFLEQYAGYVCQNPWMAELAKSLYAQDELIPAREKESPGSGLVLWIREGQRRGEIDASLDSQRLAELLQAMLTSCFTRWGKGGSRRSDLEKDCQLAVRVFFSGARKASDTGR